MEKQINKGRPRTVQTKDGVKVINKHIHIHCKKYLLSSYCVRHCSSAKDTTENRTKPMPSEGSYIYILDILQNKLHWIKLLTWRFFFFCSKFMLIYIIM